MNFKRLNLNSQEEKKESYSELLSEARAKSDAFYSRGIDEKISSIQEEIDSLNIYGEETEKAKENFILKYGK
ncbi:MAG: hypothetical protein PHY30_02440 [Candidatus Pacebacteria bacterium]|nr:hypothetical protein [Candidatus Paceibacterota bacterium]